MRKYLLVAAVLAVSCGLVSCPVTEEQGDDMVKPPIVLQLAAANNTASPINVQIRHYYRKGWPNLVGDISYSDWKEYDIPAGGGAMLGDETAVGVETEWSGFVLLDDELNHYFGFTDGYSSFEIKVTIGEKVIQLAGYESEAPCFTETLLCNFRLQVAPFGPIWREVLLFHKQSEHILLLWEPTLLSASLDIHADGTYTFDMEPPWELPED
jgi:hypothetical protein